MGIIGDIQYKCEGRDFFPDSQNADKKHEVREVNVGAGTGVVPEGAQVFSTVRSIATDVRDGLIVLTLGVWCAVLGGEGPTSQIADAIEGWLIGRSRRVPSGPVLFALELATDDGTVVVPINEVEGAVLVEELHRALGALESEREGDPRDDGEDDDARADTEPAPAPSFFPGYHPSLGEVCS